MCACGITVSLESGSACSVFSDDPGGVCDSEGGCDSGVFCVSEVSGVSEASEDSERSDDSSSSVSSDGSGVSGSSVSSAISDGSLWRFAALVIPLVTRMEAKNAAITFLNSVRVAFSANYTMVFAKGVSSIREIPLSRRSSRKNHNRSGTTPLQ